MAVCQYLVLDGTSVYDRLRQPKFHLLTFSNLGAQKPRPEMKIPYAELIDFTEFQITSDVIEKFGHDGPFTVFLRPDNYVALISAGSSGSDVSKYLADLRDARAQTN